jgi:ABC-type sulfate transport system permease component
MNIGWERKIGYSFFGLMVGNVASVLVLILTVMFFPGLDTFIVFMQFSKPSVEDTLVLSIWVCLVSVLCWVVIGLPVALLLRAEIVARFYWIPRALTGAVLGMLPMFLLLVAVNRQHLDMPIFREPETVGLFSVAALIGGVAFSVYGAEVKAALRGQRKENGAPNGTPRSLAWFDF